MSRAAGLLCVCQNLEYIVGFCDHNDSNCKKMNVWKWMNGRIYGWMGGWINGWIDE